MLAGALSLLTLLAIPSASAIQTIQLTKRDLGLKNADGSVNFSGLKSEASRLAKKYERNRKNWRFHAFNENPKARSSRKRGTATLTHQDTAVWTGKVQIGTPAQSFDIYFDTGSSDFTVASSNCPSSSCGTKNRYNVGASTTAVQTSTTITTNFVDGTSSSGNLVEDTVKCASLTATGQDVIAATSLSSTVSDLESDGMGLAYPALSQAYSNSLPFTLYNQNQGGRPQWFGLRLNNNGVSQLTLGGYNRARVTGQIRYFNVKIETGSTFRTYWQIGASAPYVNGVQAIKTRVNHILDSGTTLIIAPPTAAAEFWGNVPGSAKYDSNFYTFPCDSAPQLEFSFSRITLTMYGISDDSFNLGYLEEDPSRCVGAVISQELGLGTSWILGDAFMTNWYIIHDVKNNNIGIGAPR
ncbi:hypothetical protein JCM11641_001350 [Rhodosporidiobolus odoratus]